jgi:hypothetical protein
VHLVDVWTLRAILRHISPPSLLYDVEYIDGHSTSKSYLIQFYSNTPYYTKHIFPGEAPIRKTLLQLAYPHGVITQEQA